MKQQVKFMSLIILALGCICGCTSTMNVQTVNPKFNSIGNKRISKAALITVKEFDVKTEEMKKNIIGEAKTGAFNAKTPIVSSESIPSILKRNLQKGFKGVGFRVTEPDMAEYFVEGEIEQFWVDEQANGLSLEYSKAYIKYDVIIKTIDGKVIWAKSVEDFSTSETSVETTKNNMLTLEQSIICSIASIFKDDSFWETFSSKM